ncbi:MAG: FG-GAP-like repeat-containing protein [Deltaproteobacteria bacterium]|nr:FG-GAP-like repeat-containing protein [Deltaproteobacteria bacterium]
MDWIGKHLNSKGSISLIKIFLFLAAGAALLSFSGCAAKPEIQSPQPTIPRADGISLAGNFRSVKIADLDNDGNPDVVGGASSPGMITINYGDGKGGISEPQHLPVKADVRSVAVADINEDGLGDIIFSVQKQTAGIKVWMNQSGREWKLRKGPGDINKYEGIKTADINGDGHMDIIAANTTSSTQGGIQVWLGNGKGNWPVETGPTSSGIYMDVLPVDLNHDGHLDLIGAGWGTYGALRVWLGDGTGNWSSTPIIEQGSFYGLSSGDLNQDGSFDILAGSFRNGIRIFTGDGRGGFTARMTPDEYLKRKIKTQSKTAAGVGEAKAPKKNRSYWSVLALDLDQDGLMDIVAGSLDSDGIKAWRNRGGGRWSNLEDVFPVAGSYYEMAIDDLDGDDQMDLCAASSGEGIKIWPGKKGALKIVQQHQIEDKKRSNNRIAVQAPLENGVYKTINGVEEYKIGTGDTLEITLWEGTTPKREEILVRHDGKISFGFVEDLPIKGKTPTELDHLLTIDFKEYIKNPRIDVVVKEYNSKFVSLSGAIASHGPGTGPGKYRLTNKSTALEMITQYGGMTRDANPGNIRVRRKSGQTIKVDLYAAINKGDLSHDLVLDDGDLVFIPTLEEGGNRVFVFGEVDKPGAYTFTGSDIRLFDAVSKAGGPTVFGNTDSTRVVRGDPASPEIITADLESLIEEGDLSQNVVLASGDMVYVPRNGWGDIKLYNKRIRPLFELLIWPARLVIDYYKAGSIINGDYDYDDD